ncbi:MAG: hypothetical protein HYZ26_03930 [Chloroflexi bacterium]|nr:hypothetical protein [Chloroflexota bacterium]
MKKLLPVLLMAAALALLLAACSAGGAEPTEEVVVPPPEIELTGLVEAPLAVPFLEAWQSSGHADKEAEAFRHWDEDGSVEAACARCHSEAGYQDYIGADGTPAGSVEANAPLGSTVTCVTCHNEVTITMTSVVMPSGIELTGLGDEARCMQCHQGRASKVTLDTKFEELGLTEDVDTVSADLRFTNIHYFAAAATKYGTAAQGGYEYPDKTYDGFFAHVDDYRTCINCHNPHTLEVKVEECAACHEDVQNVEDLKNVRMYGSLVDYDGDGDIQEGVYYEMTGLQEALYAAIQTYAADVAGAPIGYDADTYPYFYGDANANGALDEGEEGYANWTARLAKAAYNYQMSIKDPGAFAHGGKYIIELLYDSIEDLNAGIDMSAMQRIDNGHFAGSEEAFRHWDEDGAVAATCSRCHSAYGLPLFLEQAVAIEQPTANGFLCTTCHLSQAGGDRYEVAQVTFPSGLVVAAEDPDSNLCMSCHQGRSSAVAVDKAVAGKGNDEVFEGRFINVHYFAAGATRYGSQAAGAAQFPGKTYAGLFEHVGPANECAECHNAHTQQVQVDKCATCHETVSTNADLATIRAEDTPDYDGDGDTAEGVAGEVEGLKELLYAAMQSYSADVSGATIYYNPGAYPYFFADSDGDGVGDANYSAWTPSLLRAAYNYQYASKDPGAFAHNAPYVVQILIDSIQAMGGSISGLVRP